MKNRIAMFALVSILSATVLMFSDVSAKADSSDINEKRATLNGAQLSFNGAAPVTVQCYNIDGYNYFRINDIVKHLNMKADPNYNAKPGIIIRENKPYNNTNALPELMVGNVTVYLRLVPMFYAGAPMHVQSFLLDNECYFKLADIQTLSDTVKATFDATKKGSFTGISVEWDAKSNVITITTTKTDYE